MITKIFDLNEQFRVVYSKSNSEIAHVGLMVGVGSCDDGIEFAGMSHFIEHMWFKGTSSRTSKQIVDDIEMLGGDFNAYTSKEETCLHISILKDSLMVALDVLSDIYFNSCFPVEELEKEREVILDEIDSYEDSPSELIVDEFEELLFEGMNLSTPILGTRKSLSKIDFSSMKSFYLKKYFNSKVVLSFVGNISFADFSALVMSYFCRTVDPIDNSLLQDEFFETKLHFNVTKNKKTNQSHCILGLKAYPYTDIRRLPLSILNNIVGGPQFSSLLSYSLRENHGLTYTIESTYTPYSKSGVFMVYFGTDKKKVLKCYDLIRVEFGKVCQSTLLQENIEIYKKQILGQLALSFDNYLSIMISQAKSVLIFDKVDSFKEITRKVNSIDSKILKDVANDILLFDKMSFLQYC